MSSPETLDTLTQAPRSKVVFTLVHGTFAKGADWVVHEKSETFCPTLKVLLDQHGSDSDETRAKFGAAFRSAIDKYEQNERSERDETAVELCEKLRKILDRYVNDESAGRIASAKKALAKHKLARAITKYEKDEATFRTELRKSLPEYDVEFDDCFAWGHGKRTRFLDNTESTRSRAIPELATYLRRRTTRNSGATHFVVAHSHAGNIALQAMNDKDVRESISGVVCLATPFLFSRERRISGRLLFWCGVALTILGWVLYQNPTFLSAVLRYLLVALMVFCALVFPLVLLSRFRSKARPVQNYRSVKEMDSKLMVIRPSGDEASGLLRTSQFVTWCLGRILARLEWLLGTLIAIAMTSKYMRDWSKQGFEWLGKEKVFNESVMPYVDLLDLDPIFGVLFVAASAIIVLMAVQWLVISFDHVGWFADLEMLAEEAPPGMTSRAVVLEPQRGGSRNLVHTGIYNRPQTIQEIASWVKEKAPQPVARAIA